MKTYHLNRLVIISLVFSMLVYNVPLPRVPDTPLTIPQVPPTGDFTWFPQNQNILIQTNVSFTPTASGGTPPYTFNWNFGDGKTGTGGPTTHVYATEGNYTVTLLVTDSTGSTITITHTIQVTGSPVTSNGWTVNWSITPHRGVEISNVTYNGVLTIGDALLDGILVRYSTPPHGQKQCLFYDQLDNDDLNTTIGGFQLQFSTDPNNHYFQFRANYNPGQVGYNYTQIWRFYQNGRWDAQLVVGHLGCGWNHIYEPHWRIKPAVGDENRGLMDAYTTSGAWQHLIWEGNSTDNEFRDPAHNATQWRIGDGHRYYYMTPTVYQWAADLPTIPSKIYLVRDRPGEIELTINPADPRIDPIVFANGELAYRQNIALWFIPSFWDHWLGFAPIVNAPPSSAMLSFYPGGT